MLARIPYCHVIIIYTKRMATKMPQSSLCKQLSFTEHCIVFLTVTELRCFLLLSLTLTVQK